MRILSICLNPTVDMYSEAAEIYPVHKVRTHSQRLSPGGGGVNVARVLSGFGVPCELVYLSGGATGSILDELLQQYPINKRSFRNAAPTRVAHTVWLSSTRQEYRFVPDGPTVSPDAFSQLLKHISSVSLCEDDIVIASGSLPPGVPDNAYASIAAVVQRQGARLFLDSSEAGLSEALDGRHAIFLVKPSLSELQNLAGQRLDEAAAQQYARKLVHEGSAQHVAVSLGSHGAFLTSIDRTIRLPAHLVKVHSAVGAGDSFVGAMVYSLSSGQTIEKAFRYALAAGAAAVMTPGDELCRPEDVEALFAA